MRTVPPMADTAGDLAAMELWAAWMAALLDHAAPLAHDHRDRATLEGAAEDASQLRHVLASAIAGWLDEEDLAVARSIYALWADTSGRLEALAEQVDPEGHRMWAGRAATARPGQVRAPASPAHTVGSGTARALASSSR